MKYLLITAFFMLTNSFNNSKIYSRYTGYIIILNEKKDPSADKRENPYFKMFQKEIIYVENEFDLQQLVKAFLLIQLRLFMMLWILLTHQKLITTAYSNLHITMC